MHSSTRWSLGVLLGGPITGLVLLISAVAMVGGIAYAIQSKPSRYSSYNDDRKFGIGMAVAGLLLGLVTTAVAAYAYWPFEKSYHQWQPHEGTISAISSRFMGDGKSTTQRFVVTFTGDPTPYSCDDTRCALLHKGDFLALSCKGEYQFSGTSGYSCNYVYAKEQ